LTTCHPQFSERERLIIHAPAPLGVRVVIAALLALGTVAALMLVVFPAVEPMLPSNDVAVDGG
jgi:hypothetical protein